MKPPDKPASAVVKNASAAPVLFFDTAPTFGHFNGVIHVTLTNGLLVPKNDQTVGIEMAAAAHLRCSVAAALSLRNALDQALKLAAETPLKLAS